MHSTLKHLLDDLDQVAVPSGTVYQEITVILLCFVLKTGKILYTLNIRNILP